MEILLVVCNLAQVPLTIVSVFATIIGFIMWLIFADLKADAKYERMGFWMFVVGLLFIPIAAASFTPQALIQARVQMIKLEVTDPAVRKKLYDGIEGFFDLLDAKYLNKQDGSPFCDICGKKDK